jgi:hypothetical protein
LERVDQLRPRQYPRRAVRRRPRSHAAVPAAASTDLSPISLERVCQTDGKAVAWDDLVKGYEVEKGRFIALTEDDFKTAAIERSRSIDIQAFVPLTSIDARFWDTPYYALPSKGARSTPTRSSHRRWRRADVPAWPST